MEVAAMDSGKAASAAVKKNPTDFLKQVIGKPVVVKLHSGVVYKGVLACLDGFMNIAMEQTEEYIDGQLKNKYGDCFIRGNNGKYWFMLVFRLVLQSDSNDLLLILVLYISATKPKK